MPEENIIKLRHFFEADLAIKRLMYTMAPSSNNCADIIQYSDQLEGMINYITSEIE